MRLKIMLILLYEIENNQCHAIFFNTTSNLYYTCAIHCFCALYIRITFVTVYFWKSPYRLNRIQQCHVKIKRNSYYVRIHFVCIINNYYYENSKLIVLTYSFLYIYRVFSVCMCWYYCW